MARILLVDDEPLILRSMQKTLLRAGYDVDTAATCPEGLQLFMKAQSSDQPFALAVLDMNMPNFEGQEASGAGLELLGRLLDCQADLPIIMLTAYDETIKAKEAIRRGARAYCVKGREQNLLDTINSILASPV